MAWRESPTSCFRTWSSASLLLGVAAWIVFLRFDDRLYRTFALYLALEGTSSILFVWVGTAQSLTARINVYFELAIPFTIVWFLYLAWLRYAAHHVATGPRRPDPRVWWAVLGCGGLVEGLYLVNHGLYFGGPRLGPLAIIEEAQTPLLAVAALLLAREYARARLDAARASLFALSLAFCLDPAYVATFFIIDASAALIMVPSVAAESWSSLVGFMFKVFDVATLVLVAFAVRAVYGAARTWPSARSAAHRYATVVGIAALSGVGVGLWFVITYYRAYFIPGRAPPSDPFFAALAGLRYFDAFWTAALPAALFIGYSLSKHRLFDLPVRTRWTVEKGTLAGVFVALAFMGTEGAQFMAERLVAFQDRSDLAPVVGVVAAGVVVFALSPLHRFAERLARRAMPDAKPLRDMDRDERAAMYREQVELAWLDGVLQRKERLLLDALQRRLGLAAAESSHIEAEVVKALAAPAPRRRRGGEAT